MIEYNGNHSVRVDCALDTPLRETRLRAILRSALKGRELDGADGDETQFWDANFYGIAHTTAFRELDISNQEEVLTALNHATLEEAWFIEKSGMAYTAKMNLLAESTEERMFYCTMAADEAAHFNAISSYLICPPRPASNNSFINLLGELIETGDRQTLIFVIQVVLEGWGLTHYHGLARDCRSLALRDLLVNIIKDEARHHGSGLILFDFAQLSQLQKANLIDIMSCFLNMIQAGPQAAATVLDQRHGGLTAQQRTEMFEQLNGVQSSAARLMRLKTLMLKNSEAMPIVRALEQKKLFVPFAPTKCWEFWV